MAERAEVLAFAAEHGPRAAARHFGIPHGTVASWQRRQRQRDQRRLVDHLAPVLADLLAGVCPCCHGAGYVYVNSRAAKARTPALAAFRYARRMVCPDCGRPRRRPVVVGANLRLAMQAAQADRQAIRELEASSEGGHLEAWRDG